MTMGVAQDVVQLVEVERGELFPVGEDEDGVGVGRGGVGVGQRS